MIEDSQLQQLITVLGEDFELTGEEIADVLWLAVQRLKSNGTITEIPTTVPEEKPWWSKLINLIIQVGNSINKKQPQAASSVQSLARVIKQEPTVPLYPETPSSVTITPRQVLPIRVPDAPSLREPLQVAQSLRPLMRRIASGRKVILDEIATAKRIAEHKIYLPIVKPETEPWLDLALVIDESQSMAIWRHAIEDLKRLVQNYGVFRDVRIWGLVTDETGEVKLLPRIGTKGKEQRFANPRELIDPNGRRLILVVSDCVSRFWYDGVIISPLQAWSQRQPLAILQMLPDWLWLRTGLGNGASVLFKSLAPGVANQNLEIEELLLRKDFALSEGIKIPVLTLDPDWAYLWSEMVSGKSEAVTSGFVLPPRLESDEKSLPETEVAHLNAAGRITRFRQTASPIARKLAGLLAAAPVINLPVVRLIQDTLLPQSTQVHVAEVFLGGLLKPLIVIEANTNPDTVQYDFMDDGIRQIFLKDAPVRDSAEVFDAVSQYVAQKLNKSLQEFVALLKAPGENTEKGISAFAEVAIKVLKGLGGEYARFATQIIPSYKPWKLRQSIENNQGQVNCIGFSPDGELIASAGHDGTICLWDLEGELINTIEGHQDKVWSIAFSVDSKLIVSGSEDRNVKVWQINNGATLKNWKIETNIYSVAFDRFMHLIAFGGGLPIVQAVEFLETEDFIGPAIITLVGHENIVNCVVFTPDGRLLASCSDDCSIKLWSHRTGELIRTLEGHENFVNEIAFSPDGKQLISASGDLTLRLWDIEGNLLKVFEGHSGSISSVAFHPSGNIIASGSRDGTVRIWNLQGDCLKILSNEEQTNVRTVAFNPQGTLLASGGEAQPIYLYSQESFKPNTFTFEIATIEVKEIDAFEFKIVTLVAKEKVSNRPKPENIYFREDHFASSYPEDSLYQSYGELSLNEQEGRDYRISSRQSDSDIAIIAPHGGRIQSGTTEIAEAIAGKDYNFYSFEGIKENQENDNLYIPSYKFGEPGAVEIVKKSSQVIAIHGLLEKGEFISLGGLDDNLKERIRQYLTKAGFTNITKSPNFRGTSHQNICNRSKTGQGVQIGVSWGLRKKLFDSLKSEDSNEQTLWDRFIQAIRDVLSPLEEAGWRYQINQGEADYYTEELEEDVGIDMVSIPGGSFIMGSPENEGYDEEKPQHKVNVPDFHMGHYPITQAQWKVVASWERVERELELEPSYFQEDYEGIDRGQRPVERISWEEAKEFCARLSKKTNKEYRLPTEAEWEYACRAGTTTPFHFGETISTEIANYSGGIYGKGVEGEYREQTTPVGYFGVANALGLSDMHGNVWEWCEDDYHEDYEGAPSDGSAWLSKDKNTTKILRGGSWYAYPGSCRSAYRFSYDRDVRFDPIGLRVVCVVPRNT